MEVVLNLQTVSKTHEQRSLWLMGSQLLFYNKALANSVQGSIGFQTFNHPKNLNIFWTFIVSSSLNVSFPLWTWSHADQYCFPFLSFLSSCHAEKNSSNQRQRLQVGTAQVRGYPPPIPQSILGLRGSFVSLWLLHRVPYQSSGQVQTSSASPGTAEAIFEYFISFANLLKHKVSNTRSRKICMRRSIEGH